MHKFKAILSISAFSGFKKKETSSDCPSTSNFKVKFILFSDFLMIISLFFEFSNKNSNIFSIEENFLKN